MGRFDAPKQAPGAETEMGDLIGEAEELSSKGKKKEKGKVEIEFKADPYDTAELKGEGYKEVSGKKYKDALSMGRAQILKENKGKTPVNHADAEVNPGDNHKYVVVYDAHQKEYRTFRHPEALQDVDAQIKEAVTQYLDEDYKELPKGDKYSKMAIKYLKEFLAEYKEGTGIDSAVSDQKVDGKYLVLVKQKGKYRVFRGDEG